MGWIVVKSRFSNNSLGEPTSFIPWILRDRLSQINSKNYLTRLRALLVASRARQIYLAFRSYKKPIIAITLLSILSYFLTGYWIIEPKFEWIVSIGVYFLFIIGEYLIEIGVLPCVHEQHARAGEN